MKHVSRFEANLLRILHGFFGRVPADRVLALVEQESDPPRCLSRHAVDLVQDTLQKGVTNYLAHNGGWRRDRFLRNERVAEGRLWDRTPADQLGFSFSKHALHFLIWITAHSPQGNAPPLRVNEKELTIGDRLLYFLAYETLRGTETARALMRQPPFERHGLAWLAYLGDLLETPPPSEWDFSLWMNGLGACVLEVLQPRLTSLWLSAERQKERITQPEIMRQLGTLQQRVLTGFFQAAERAERRDLCRFFLTAMNHLFRITKAGPSFPQLNLQGLRMADRMEVYQAALTNVRQMERLEQWNRQARSIGFYEEGYAAAQLWKADWEEWDGDWVRAQARERIRQTEPLSFGARTNASTLGELNGIDGTSSDETN